MQGSRAMLGSREKPEKRAMLGSPGKQATRDWPATKVRLGSREKLGSPGKRARPDWRAKQEIRDSQVNQATQAKLGLLGRRDLPDRPARTYSTKTTPEETTAPVLAQAALQQR